MRFDTFGCCKKEEKKGILHSFMESFLMDVGPACAYVAKVSEDRQSFYVILCCAGKDDYDHVGRDYAIDCGEIVMQTYLGDRNKDTLQLFVKMLTRWRNELAWEYSLTGKRDSVQREKLYKKMAPSFLAVASTREELLLVQCGDGYFMQNKGNVIDEFCMDNGNHGKGYIINGFYDDRCPFYIQKSRDIPDALLMISPHKSNRLQSVFRDFLNEAHISDFRNREKCLDILYQEIADIEQQYEIQTGIAGFRVNSKRSIPENNNYLTNSGSIPIQAGNVKHKKTASVVERTSLSKKKQLDRLVKLKAELKNAEEELLKQKQIQSDIQVQLQNLDSAYRKSMEQLLKQEEYVENKRKSGRCQRN